MSIATMFNGIGGTVHGSFFQVDDSVDTAKAPGATPVGYPHSLSETVLPIVTGKAFAFSPNSSWFLLACAVWYWKPYRLDEDDDITWKDHLEERMMVNMLLVFGYVGFWHVALYWWHWGKRPFVANRSYQWGKVLHNMFYTWLGTVQWTATEVAFLYCYQHGKISYRQEPLSLNHPTCLWQTLLLCILLPNFRDVHFYFAHRLIHCRFIYKYIHSLHHRNSDIEPFAGLCMHPLEHMFYFTCYAPCLLFHLHPIILFWMGVHLLLAPAASHSGFEDHFSADLVHYLHHRYTDCNYGVPQSIPFDVWFGTYLGEIRTRDNADTKKSIIADPKARLGIIPDHPVFNASWVILWCCICWYGQFFHQWPILGAILLSMGPIVLALLCEVRNDSPSQRSLIAPFHQNPFWSQVLHFGLGFLLGVLPATLLVYHVLR